MSLQFVFPKSQGLSSIRCHMCYLGRRETNDLSSSCHPPSGQLAMTLGNKVQNKNDAMCFFFRAAKLFFKDIGPDFPMAQAVLDSLEMWPQRPASDQDVATCSSVLGIHPVLDTGKAASGMLCSVLGSTLQVLECVQGRAMEVVQCLQHKSDEGAGGI